MSGGGAFFLCGFSAGGDRDSECGLWGAECAGESVSGGGPTDDASDGAVHGLWDSPGYAAARAPGGGLEAADTGLDHAVVSAGCGVEQCADSTGTDGLAADGGWWVCPGWCGLECLQEDGIGEGTSAILTIQDGRLVRSDLIEVKE